MNITGLFIYRPVMTTLVMMGILTLNPHPAAKDLWDQYIHPAPWPPWRRRAQTVAEGPAAAPPQETAEQTPKE